MSVSLHRRLSIQAAEQDKKKADLCREVIANCLEEIFPDELDEQVNVENLDNEVIK
jgi:hypothetical protein